MDDQAYESTVHGQQQQQNSLTSDIYHTERGRLIEIEGSGSDSHDKAILQLSAGALALSITFLDKISANPPQIYEFIAISWSFFVFSIIFILGSFHTSQRACRRERDLLDEEFHFRRAPPDSTNKWSIWTERLTVASYGCFVAGVFFFALFSWFNLPTGS